MADAPNPPTGAGGDWFSRVLLFVAGILGAGGMAAAAAASHTGDAYILGNLALIGLTQAPALLVIALGAPAGRMLRAGAGLIGIGALLFCADLAVRHLTDNRLFPVSAPIGGTAMIGGWLVIAFCGLLTRRA